MLPRLKQWFEEALSELSPRRPTSSDDEALSSFIDDDKLSVSESTLTEFSRAVASYEPRESLRA